MRSTPGSVMHTQLLSAAVSRRLAVICIPSQSLSAASHPWTVYPVGDPSRLQPTCQTSKQLLHVASCCIANRMDGSSSSTAGTFQARGMPESKRRVLDQSWTIAAQLYLQELAPRFTPWLSDGIRALLDAQPTLPHGLPVLVPCCGPGHELPVLHRYLQRQHPVIGSDLAEGMVQLAKSVIDMELKGQLKPHSTQSTHSEHSTLKAGCPQDGNTSVQPGRFDHELVQAAVSKVLTLVASQLQAEQLPPAHAASRGSDLAITDLPAIQAEQSDACMLDQQYSGSAAAVISVFGLQQLGSLAPEALASWVRCLAPGGVAIVVLWPSQTEPPGGPWAAYSHALDEQLAASSASQEQSRPASQSGSTSTSETQPWEESLTSLAAQVPGCSLVADTMLKHTMVWDDADIFWQVMTQGGPWHARRLVSGDAFMDQLKLRWLKLVDLPSLQAQHTQLVGAADDQLAACIPFLQQGSQQGQACQHAFAHHPCARMVIIRRDKQDAYHPGARQEARL